MTELIAEFIRLLGVINKASTSAQLSPDVCTNQHAVSILPGGDMQKKKSKVTISCRVIHVKGAERIFADERGERSAAWLSGASLCSYTVMTTWSWWSHRGVN